MLHEISLHARPGETIALVGRTGSGKTSIVNLIARFYLPDSGQVTFDGIDTRQVSDPSLRKQLGIVLQNNFLFTGTVRENIRTLRKVRHALQDLVMYKGSSWGREVRAAEREAERLGFKLDTVMEHELPEDMGKHAILVYRAPGGAGM